MNLVEIYRNQFLSGRGFATGSKFSVPDAWKASLGNYFYTGDYDEVAPEMNPQPETVQDYLKMKEVARQQSSGQRVATSPLTYKLGRKIKSRNKYFKYL